MKKVPSTNVKSDIARYLKADSFAYSYALLKKLFGAFAASKENEFYFLVQIGNDKNHALFYANESPGWRGLQETNAIGSDPLLYGSDPSWTTQQGIPDAVYETRAKALGSPFKACKIQKFLTPSFSIKERVPFLATDNFSPAATFNITTSSLN